MSSGDISRRSFLKFAGLSSVALGVGGMGFLLSADKIVYLEDGVVPDAWKKGVCRFCGTGCGMEIGVKSGRVVAIREPILSSLPVYSRYCRRKFGAHERQYGVTENAFTMREWRDLFRRAGFRCLFVPSRSESRPTSAKARLLRLVENSPLRKPLALLRPKYVIILAKDAAQNAAEDA